MISEDLRRWFKEKWTAQDGSDCGNYKGRGRVKCRPSKRVSGKSPQTWSEMSPEQKKKAVKLKQKAHREGKQFSSHKSGKTWDGSKNKYKPGKKKMDESNQNDCGCDQNLTESKKPYKGFVKGKNHPEGGLSRKEAHRQGIHAGIETKDEAKRKGGFGKLSGKTQARRKSFCARMCGMKRRNTSSKTANDPKSKINAALRVWGCRCGTNESYEIKTPMLTEGKNRPTNAKLWSRAKALARRKFDVYPSAYANGWASKWYKKHGGGWESKSTTEGYETKTSMLNHKISLNEACWKGYTAKGTKMKNGRQVPNCVPISENTMTPLQEAYARAKHAIKEEIVNKSNKGTMSGKERSKRDRIAKSVKGIKSIKGKPDSDKEAKYRYATYLVLRAREGKSSKSEKSNTKSSKKPSKKTKKR